MKIFNNIIKAFKEQKPFVAYNKPNEKVVSAFFQHSDTLFSSGDYTESGFVFAPFNTSNKTVLIPGNEADFFQETISVNHNFELNSEIKARFSAKENHITLVEKAIAAIVVNQFKKVVLSRKEIVNLSSFDVLNTFQKLLQEYPRAMVYVWFHPKVGLWFGATPETLVKIKGTAFETMALAGTQEFKDTIAVTWQQKEIDEQQFVTDYIVDNLEKVSQNVRVFKTETVKAGSLLHLKTKISGDLREDIAALIHTLHPTPAVCGLPTEKAKQFILEYENYDRSYYTGFLGELNMVDKNQEKSSNLYVNLRCMSVEKEEATIFIGGGITKDSDSKKEWEETVAKTRIMKRVL